MFDWTTASNSQALWRELTDREVQEPFDLERGPLFRARLARLAADEHRLALTAHHTVCDGWSTG